MFRNWVLAIALVACAGSSMAQNEKAAVHPQQQLKQFMKQCMDANDNQALCQCAQNAYKDVVPVGEGRLEGHEQYEGKVLQIDDEYIAKLEPEIAKCEAKFRKH